MAKMQNEGALFNQQNLNLSSTTLTKGSALARNKLVDFYSDFQSEMRSLLNQLADEKAEKVKLKGNLVEKNGMAFTLLMEQWSTDNQTAMSQLLNIYQFSSKLEDMLNKSS